MKQFITVYSLVILAFGVCANEPIDHECKARLQTIIRKYHPDANIEEENDRLVYRFHTQTFKMHTIHKTGHISEKAHDEEGPNVDGILVTVTLREGKYEGPLETPQTLNRPYWRTFVNAYSVPGPKYLWLSVSYGSRTDKKLIEELKTCLGPLVPQKGSAKNQVFRKVDPAAAPDKK